MCHCMEGFRVRRQGKGQLPHVWLSCGLCVRVTLFFLRGCFGVPCCLIAWCDREQRWRWGGDGFSGHCRFPLLFLRETSSASFGKTGRRRKGLGRSNLRLDRRMNWRLMKFSFSYSVYVRLFLIDDGKREKKKGENKKNPKPNREDTFTLNAMSEQVRLGSGLLMHFIYLISWKRKLLKFDCLFPLRLGNCDSSGILVFGRVWNGGERLEKSASAFLFPISGSHKMFL